MGIINKPTFLDNELYEATENIVEVREFGFEINTNNMPINKRYRFEFQGQEYVTSHVGDGSVYLATRNELYYTLKQWILHPREMISDLKDVLFNRKPKIDSYR